jgi:hypothetical protein
MEDTLTKVNLAALLILMFVSWACGVVQVLWLKRKR